MAAVLRYKYKNENPKMNEKNVPHVHELLKDSPKNWGKWGPDDEVGALNYLTGV